MTKADIIAEIVASTGVAKKDVAVTIEAFMNVIRDNMVDGENIYLRGFGTFVVKKRAEKTARNISKNTTITIPAHNFPGFKPAKSFLQRMMGEEVTSED
ncbi:MAG: HU family DNA-binding protein [Prevotella sp.]|nr:HU family DNA-binding protein [Prevotella sp.]MDY4161448.1 HU family DNA-binding protein [Prevotella sp.]